MKTRSIRFKTSVLYSSILCVILACFSMYLFHTVRQILYEDEQEDLQIESGQIKAFLNAYASISLRENSPAGLMNKFLSASGETVSDREIIDELWKQEVRSLGLRKDLFRILSSKGRVILRSENMTNEMDRVFDAQFLFNPDVTRFTNLKFNKINYNGISDPFKFSNRNVFVLQLASSMAPENRLLSKLVFFIIEGILAILLMTIFMGAFLTRRILKPVTDITQAANNISQKNLNMRLPEKELDQEMEELVKSFNRMIERLEQSFAHVNEFSSHVAHELKTPLAIIKSELELALGDENTKADDKRVMKVALGEIDRLIRTIKDLLLLAKLEYKLNIFNMEKIDLTEFLNDIYQHSKILAEEKKIKLTLVATKGPVLIEADPVHLRRVFFNLVHNAVKFTPSHGEITISIDLHDKQAFISIKDTGIGIDLADQSRIFEKFFRIRRIDQDDFGGNGLGLSMARAVAKSHGGDIIVKSEIAKGSVFTVILPILPS